MTKKKSTEYIPSEYEECRVLVDYLIFRQIPFAHIHQEMFTKSWSQKMKAKKLGVQSGLPDYIIVLPNYLLFIEMKKIKGGYLKESQRYWYHLLNSISHSIKSFIARGAGEAIEIIEKYYEK